MRFRLECWAISLPDDPRRLLATMHEDGRVEGDSPVTEDFRRIVDRGYLEEHLFDHADPYSEPTFRRTLLGDPNFLPRLANYFNKQSGGYIQFLVLP